MIAPLLLATLTGCMNNPLKAPATAVIESTIQSYDIEWGESYNGVNDGIGAVVFFDFWVYDSQDDMPLENIEVEVFSSLDGVYVLPPEALRLVDYPSIPEGYSVADCEDDNGNFDNATYEWCGWVYDTITGQYYEFGSDYADNDESGESYNPTYMIDATDDRGLVRAWIYVDRLPLSGDSYSSGQITATIGVDSTIISVGPGGSD